MQEFHKIFTPYKHRKSSSKDNSQRYINVQYKEINFHGKAQTTSHRHATTNNTSQEYSPSHHLKGGFQENYHHQVKGIGKQPMQEIKFINE
jgi:hypothetical protein